MKPEDIIQKQVVTYIRMKDLLVFSSQNGTYKTIQAAVKANVMGQCAGEPDLFIAKANNKYHGLYLELKHGKNKTTKTQDIIILKLQELGYYVGIAYTFEDSKLIIDNYLANKL